MKCIINSIIKIYTNMSSMICSTCLSYNRTLVLFDRDKYGSLFGSRIVMEMVAAVCWECMYMFKKLYRFKSQVLYAQESLKSKSSKITNLSPLSCLRCSTVNYNDICCNKNNDNLSHVKHDVNIIKTFTQIKSENESDEKVDENVHLRNLPTINGFKSDEIIKNTETLDTSTVKLENDYDLYTDEITVEELSVNELTVKKKKDIYVSSKTKTEKNLKSSKSKWCIVTKDNYIITKMSEEEMLAKRETDRQADRYKNKVKYKCELCIVGFFHKDLYEKHIRSKHSEKAGIHQCAICETRFTKANYYKEHIESHYRSYGCNSCGYVGYKLSEMAAHDARAHGLARFPCRVCRELFPSPSSLRFHRETMHEAPVKCESCGKMFRTKNGLRVHTQQMHSYKPKSPCPLCGARVRYLQSHMRKHGAAPEAAYCAECDQRFTSTASYKSHLKYAARHRAPDTVLRHECAVCGARFVNSTGLKKHTLARHSTVRPYKCDKCGKGFEAQCKLKLHTLHAHEGVEKPKDKICHICGRGFNTKFMLSNHIRVHTGEKPFRCDICGAAFSQKSSLTTHTRGVHLKIRPRPGRAPRP